MAVGHAAKTPPQADIEYLTLDEYVRRSMRASRAGRATPSAAGSERDVLLGTNVSSSRNGKKCSLAGAPHGGAAGGGAADRARATARRPTSPTLDERLISRHVGRAVVDMGTPDYETRVAILRARPKTRARGSSRAAWKPWPGGGRQRARAGWAR